jgi:hypothetical protein
MVNIRRVLKTVVICVKMTVFTTHVKSRFIYNDRLFNFMTAAIKNNNYNNHTASLITSLVSNIH